jgi:hypothetical protein
MIDDFEIIDDEFLDTLKPTTALNIKKAKS